MKESLYKVQLNKTQMLEFTCFSDLHFDYVVQLRFLGQDFFLEGSKDCSLLASGVKKEVSVPLTFRGAFLGLYCSTLCPSLSVS